MARKLTILMLSLIFGVSNSFAQGRVTRPSENRSTVPSAKKVAPKPSSVNGHEAIDLGLSVKWASCNVGANSPEKYGDYFAWGELKTKQSYRYENCNTWGQLINDFSGDNQYDVASNIWGGGWRMPTRQELEELLKNCRLIENTVNGIKGYKVISKRNGNSIFLPVGGRFSDEIRFQFAGSSGYYWSSTPSQDPKDDDFSKSRYSHYLLIGLGDLSNCVTTIGRCHGFNIRPVVDK